MSKNTVSAQTKEATSWRRKAGEMGESLRYAEVLRGRDKAVSTEKQSIKRSESEGDIVFFQSTEDDVAWLREAFTGCLKKSFSWSEHDDELQNESVGKLKLSDMGNNLVLIRSEGEEKTSEVIKGFEEWSSFWFDWWRP